MASSKISDFIETLKSDESLSAETESLISLLEKKQSELGDDVTDEQVEEVIKKCLEEHIAETIGLSINNSSDEKTQKFMQNATSAVKSFFEGEGWHYTERISRPDYTVYEMGFSIKNCNLRMRVHVEASPEVCRVDAIFPITADKTYDYLLSKAITKENYPRRFGALQYDEEDGEVSYRYSYPISHGVYTDDLRWVFLAVANSAADSYAEIRKHCIGKYKQKEITDILQNVSDLVNDLSDYSE